LRIRLKRVSLAWLSIIISLLSAVFAGYSTVIVETSQYQLASENERLQLLTYNYTSQSFGYATGAINVSGSQYHAQVIFHVIIVTPHNGYATVNQTYFKFNGNPAFDNHTDITLLGDYIMAVSGTSEQSFELTFDCAIYPSLTYFHQGNITGIETVIGAVGLEIIYHDVQLRETFTSDVYEVPVLVNYIL